MTSLPIPSPGMVAMWCVLFTAISIVTKVAWTVGSEQATESHQK